VFSAKEILWPNVRQNRNRKGISKCVREFGAERLVEKGRSSWDNLTTRMVTRMAKRKKIELPRDKIADFCKKNHIRKLSLFGSALRGELRKDSDIDMLVEFRPGETPSLFDLARMERELSTLVGGRKVDLGTPQDLSRYFRDEVLSSATVEYAEG
jgi:uncharacterized protein